MCYLVATLQAACQTINPLGRAVQHPLCLPSLPPLALNCWPAQREQSSTTRTHSTRLDSSWSGANNHSSNHIVIIINNFALSLPNNGNGNGCAMDGTTSCVAWPGCWLALDVALANRLIILSRVGQTPNKNATRRPVMCSSSSSCSFSSSCSKVRQARMVCYGAARLLNFSICHKGLAVIYICAI